MAYKIKDSKHQNTKMIYNKHSKEDYIINHDLTEDDFIRNVFKHKYCKNFKRQPKNSTICVCGASGDDHMEFSEQDENGFVPATDFGRLTFVGKHRDWLAPFVRIADNGVDIYDNIKKLMKEYWHIHDPQIIISVTGGAKKLALSSEQREFIKLGLMRMATISKAWIVTGGTDQGVMQLCGEAVADHRQLTGDENFVLLGIATWGVISGINRGLSANRSEQNKLKTMTFKSYLSQQICTYKASPEQVGLDCNHTHFLLFDDGTTGKFGGEIKFRATLEASFPNVTVVCVLIEGGPGSIKTVYEALCKSTPVVIIDKTGRAANVFGDVWQYIQDACPEYQCSEEYAKFCKSKEFISTIRKRLNVYFGDDGLDVDKASSDIHLSFKDYLKWITVFTKTSAIDRIDVAIMRGVTKTIPFINQLQYALELNHLPIGKEILSNHVLQNSSDLDQVLFHAIELKNVAYLELLLENGADFNRIKVEEFLRLIRKCLPKCKILNLHKFYSFIENLIETDCFTCLRGSLNVIYLPEPVFFLFTYALLAKNLELSCFFLKECKQYLSNCLYAYRLLHAITGFFEYCERKRLVMMASHFENKAIELITSCWSSSVEKTEELLVIKVSNLGSSAIDFAYNSKSRHFLATVPAQHVFKKMWYGDLKLSNSYSAVVFSCFFFFTIPFLKFTKGLHSKYSDSLSHRTSENIASFRFFHAPMVKFIYNILSFIIFLLLFSYFLIFDYNFAHSTHSELVLLFFVITFIIEELRQLVIANGSSFQKATSYFKDFWNTIDCLAIFLFMLGFCIRFCKVAESSIFVKELCQVSYVFSFIAYFLRLMHICYLHHKLGPKIIMIAMMLSDILFFIVILFIFMISCGVASYSLAEIPFHSHRNLSFYAVANNVLFYPYFRVYGELFVEENKGVFSGSFRHNVSIVLLMFYMMITNVLLLNLLIAMFGDTYQKVQSNADTYWKTQLFGFLYEYRRCLPPPPPPFVIICQCLYFFEHLVYRKQFVFEPMSFNSISEDKKWRLLEWERLCARNVLRRNGCDNNMNFDDTVVQSDFSATAHINA